jgi:tripartite-type tricarboxylate transporter receptor subunit TctC
MTIRLIAVALFGALTGSGAYAQSGTPERYPQKPVRIVVAYTAGGPTDVVARVIAQKLSEAWGQQVLVDNRPGASGVIGSEFAVHAPADGYTLLMATMGNLAVNPYLYPKLSMELGRDYVPIMRTAAVDFVLVASPSFSAKNVKELIAMAKAQPEAIMTATSGAGGAPHLAAELFMKTANVKLTNVPYKGTADAVNALLGGQVNIDFDSVSQVLPHILSGKLKPLAILGRNRSPLLPEVPTMAEAGLPGYELTNWFGLVAPAGTPREIVDRIHAEVSKALAQADVKAKFVALGLQPGNTTVEQFSAFVKSEYAKWGAVVRDANITAQ